MKTLLLIALLATLAAAQNPHTRSISGGKMKQSLPFDGKMFILKFIDQTKIVDLNEYYLPNEQPENWTQMLSVTFYKTPLTPAAMAKNMERGLLEQHPDAPHEYTTAPDGSVLFFCLNWARDRRTDSEFSIFRFQKRSNGVLGYQASFRPFQAKISLDDYKALRDRWIKKIQVGQWPDVMMQMP